MASTCFLPLSANFFDMIPRQHASSTSFSLIYQDLISAPLCYFILTHYSLTHQASHPSPKSSQKTTMEGMSIQYDGQIDFMHQHAGRGGTPLLRAWSWIAFCLIIPALLVLKGPWQCPGFIGATLFISVRRIISITESSHVWTSLLD